MSVGMHDRSGQPLDLDAHIEQSIRRILTTPVGSRVMRRDFGSLVPRFVDAPGNDATILRLLAAAAAPIVRWEPRVELRRLGLSVEIDGRATLDIDAMRRVGPAAQTPLALSIRLGAP